MTEKQADRPEVLHVETSDLRAALAAGWSDFTKAPLYGLFFAGVESSLFRVFLGVILLFAVILNTYIRRIITGER